MVIHIRTFSKWTRNAAMFDAMFLWVIMAPLGNPFKQKQEEGKQFRTPLKKSQIMVFCAG